MRSDGTVVRYGVLLVLLACAFTFAMVAPPVRWARFVTALLQGGALMVALTRPLTERTAIGVGLGASVFALAGASWAWVGGPLQEGLADLVSAVVLALIPVTIFREFRRNLRINLQSVMASLCVYVVVGMFFAALASAVSNLGGVPYFANHTTADSSEYTYFSFITMATIGYGDFVPALPLGRALAVLEGLIGQLYLVTVVALVVGNLGWRRGED
jgi:hypothetical protein